MQPELAHVPVSRDADVRPAQTDFRFSSCAIEESHRERAAGEGPRPDFLIAGFPNLLALLAVFVLIHSYDLVVGENCENFRTHIAQIVSRQQRRREHGPEAHVRSVFGLAHRAVTDLQHVGIVPMTRLGPLREFVLTKPNS